VLYVCAWVGGWISGWFWVVLGAMFYGWWDGCGSGVGGWGGAEMGAIQMVNGGGLLLMAATE